MRPCFTRSPRHRLPPRLLVSSFLRAVPFPLIPSFSHFLPAKKYRQPRPRSYASRSPWIRQPADVAFWLSGFLALPIDVAFWLSSFLAFSSWLSGVVLMFRHFD